MEEGLVHESFVEEGLVTELLGEELLESFVDITDDEVVGREVSFPNVGLGTVFMGAGGAVREGKFGLMEASFMSDFAVQFISTKEIGNMPILCPNFPSAQFSSTLRITDIMSPFTNERQSFSSTSVTRKS